MIGLALAECQGGPRGREAPRGIQRPICHMAVATVLDCAVFRKTCARFATGIAVATVTGLDGRPYGITVNSFTSVSAAPPLVLVCIDYRSSVLAHFRGSAWYGINVLSEGQRSLSERFAARVPDRFEQLGWHAGECGVPLFDECLATMECSVVQTVEAGDHAILIAEVIRAKARDGNPLLYFGSQYRNIEGSGAESPDRGITT
jgi:flavin reductase (DIM6/NTAB) family NADH-FMN oxidoreductase RutF